MDDIFIMFIYHGGLPTHSLMVVGFMEVIEQGAQAKCSMVMHYHKCSYKEKVRQENFKATTTHRTSYLISPTITQAKINTQQQTNEELKTHGLYGKCARTLLHAARPTSNMVSSQKLTKNSSFSLLSSAWTASCKKARLESYKHTGRARLRPTLAAHTLPPASNARGNPVGSKVLRLQRKALMMTMKSCHAYTYWQSTQNGLSPQRWYLHRS